MAATRARSAQCRPHLYLPLYFQVVHGLRGGSGPRAHPVVMTVPGSMLSGRSMMHLTRYGVGDRGRDHRDRGGRRDGALVGDASRASTAVTLIGFVGTVYPVATVSIRTRCRCTRSAATGAIIFRALASTLAVAVMGAIRSPGRCDAERGAGVESWWKARAPPAST